MFGEKKKKQESDEEQEESDEEEEQQQQPKKVETKMEIWVDISQYAMVFDWSFFSPQIILHNSTTVMTNQRKIYIVHLFINFKISYKRYTNNNK